MPLRSNVKWSPDGFCELNYRTIAGVLDGTNVNDKIAILEGIRWVSDTFYPIYRFIELDFDLLVIRFLLAALDRYHRRGT